MQGRNYALIGILVLFAAFIWLRDTAWVSTASDTLPILIAIPLFIWLGSPWSFTDNPSLFSIKWISVTVILFLLGIILNLTIVLAASWTILLWDWLSSITNNSEHATLKKLLILPLMAFPWVTLDASRLGWWFRLSGAWTTAKFFELLGFEVTQNGTSVVVNGLPISIEAACAGLNTLQSLLIAGTVVAYILLKDSPKFWWNLPILAGMAWISNTARIILLTLAALLVSPDFALGAFHTWGGWFILMIMFGLCWLIFALQEPKPMSDL